MERHFKRPYCCSCRAVLQITVNGKFARSAMSSSECIPSERLRIHSMAIFAAAAILVSPNRGVKATLSKLRFAFWHRIAVDRVVFDHIECLGDHTVRLGQMIGPYEIEIVRRGVILGNLRRTGCVAKVLPTS